MRVATLNFHNAYNYGAVFQADALQHIIEELGADCDIIDYRNQTVEEQYLLKRVKLNASLFRTLRANLVLLPFITKKKINFQKWFDQYKKTDQVNRDQLPSLKYDKYIVGSDQVWNMACHGIDTSFFLDFVDDINKKVAYAASFGSYNVRDEYSELFCKYLPNFYKISVREARGAEIVEKYTGKKTVCTMDPVLLVGKQHWLEHSSNTPKYKDRYIFVYQLGHGTNIPNFVRKLKRKLNLPIVYITGHVGNMAHYSLMDKNCSSSSPELFLSLLIQAEYIVTNSFHATALSLLFKKKFFSVVNGGEKDSFNSRIYNLLSDYALEGRITSNYDDTLIESSLDYKKFESEYEKNRALSIDYLRDALEL